MANNNTNNYNLPGQKVGTVIRTRRNYCFFGFTNYLVMVLPRPFYGNIFKINCQALILLFSRVLMRG